MPPASTEPFLKAVRDANLLDPARLAELENWLNQTNADPQTFARELTGRGWLTPFQVREIYKGQGAGLRLGPYILVDLIGEGGMGRVFRAYHTRLGRDVALKVIRSDKVAKPAVVQRFHQEIQAVAQLSHPNVVLALDADEVNGTHFYAMEFVDGTDLTRLVRNHGPLPVQSACDYIRQAAIGLQHAADMGLVHRDVKPSNLMVTPQGLVKVLDLGLAMLKETPGGEAANRVTQDGLLIGTPDFLAPEQAQNPTGVDSRADVYSLGATLFYLLTGKVPYEGSNATEKLLKHITEPPPNLAEHRSDAPPELSGVIAHLMAKQPDDRPPSPAYAAAALGPYCPPSAGQPYPGMYPGQFPGQMPGMPAPLPPTYTAVQAPAAPPAAQPANSGQPFPAAAPAPAPGFAQPQFENSPGFPQFGQETPGFGFTTEEDQVKEAQERSARTASKYRKGTKGNPVAIKAILFTIIGIAGIAAAIGLSSIVIPDTTPPPSETFENSLKMKMVYLEPAVFDMGSPEDEIGFQDDEGPVSEVTITEPFFIASTEVTHSQFAAVMGRSPSQTAIKSREPPVRPVDNVTWREAVDFCNRLTEREQDRHRGWGYRLPTEAEWEYACRAGTTTPFSFGERVIQIKEVVCSIVDNDPYADTDPDTPEQEQANVYVTYPVGSTKPNQFGLHDMHGNVWEWVSDFYAKYPDGPRVDPRGPESGDWRVVRGGAYDEESERCRSGARWGLAPNERHRNIGFRVVYSKLK